MDNTVMRKCDKCGSTKKQDDFRYLGDGVWVCFCGSMYTHVFDVIEN